VNAFEILSVKTPERLFPNDAEGAKKLYRELLKKWHPDACKDKDAQKVSEHVIKLHDLAQRRIAEGSWGYAGTFEVVGLKGSIAVRYLKSSAFELGRAILADNDYYLLYEPAHLRLGRNFTRAALSFRYANPKMEQEVRRYLPVGSSSPHKGLIRVPKAPGLLCLRDVLDYYGGCMSPPHVAWILSTLYNLLCYFSYARFAHNDISPDTYFIDPEKHSGALLGGWFYATDLGQPLKHVPTRTYNLLPFKVKATKKASRATDAALVAAVGRELLGDITGKNLSESIVPRPMLDWLNAVHKSDAIENYRLWGKVLVASFGKRKFVEMGVRSGDLYPIND
jgi:hypothetical protein